MKYIFILLFLFSFVFSDQNLDLSKEEKEFIEKKTFNIAITKNWYPFSFEGDDKKAHGISSEIWELIVNKTKLKTTNIFFNSFDEQIKSFQNGKSDIIFSAGESKSRKDFALFTNEYLKFPISIATKKDEHFIENIDDIINRKIAVGNNFTSHNLLKEKYPNIDLVLVSSAEEGLKLVSKDKVFAFVDIKPVLTYNISKFNLKDLKVTGNTGVDLSLKIMIQKEHKELIPILNKAIANISQSEVQSIVDGWNNIKFQTLKDYTIIWILLFILFLIVVAFVHRTLTLNILNLKLKHTVKEKTKELQILNENLQIAIDKKTKELLEKEAILNQQSKMAAMGEMLENIAHQWRQPLSVISTLVTSMKLKKELNMLEDDEFIKNMDLINQSSQHLSNTIDDFRNFFKIEKESRDFEISKSLEKAIYLLSSRIENHDIKIVKNLNAININSYENELIQVLINILNNAIDVLKTVKNAHRYIFIDCFSEENKVVLSIKDSAGGIDKNIISRIFEPYFTTKHKSQGTGIGLYMSIEIVTKHLKGELTVSNQNFKYNNSNFTGALFKIVIPIK